MFDLELVEWVDARGITSEWVTLEEALKTNPAIILSVGFVIKEEEKYILVIPHMCPDSDYDKKIEFACGEMAIPKTSILGRKMLLTKQQYEFQKKEI